MKKYFSLIIFLLLSSQAFANYDHITQKIKHLEKENHIKIGVSAIHIESGRFFHYRQDESFKMGSSSKLPKAIYFLKLVSEGKLSLSQMVELEPQDLVLGSGLMGYYLTYPKLSISLHNLLEPMMAISCNTSSDAILRVIGGPKAVDDYLKANGFKNIHVNSSFFDLYVATSAMETIPPKETWTLQKWKEWIRQAPVEKRIKATKEFYASKNDTTTPRDMTRLLIDLFNGSLLGEEYSTLLLETMQRCKEDRRIRKAVPAHIKIAHKTGTWYERFGKGAQWGSLSDTGIIYLPGEGGHIALSIYTDSSKVSCTGVHCDQIAKVAKLIYNEFSK